MGLHNQITEHKYNQIKTSINHLQPQYETVADLDQSICGLYGVGMSTAKNIRLTNDYQAYCERVFRFHGHPGKKAKPVAKEVVETRTERRINSNLKDVDHLIERYADDMRTSSILLGGIEKLCMQLDGDHQAIMENQLNISRRLRVYIILDCVLVFIMAATIALLAWKGCGY